jgi:hypothetical protein
LKTVLFSHHVSSAQTAALKLPGFARTAKYNATSDDSVQSPGREVVDTYHMMTLGEKRIAQVRAKEAGGAVDRQSKQSPPNPPTPTRPQ